MIAHHDIEAPGTPSVTHLVTLSGRRRTPTATTNPVNFILIGSRVLGADRLTVEVRIEHTGTLDTEKDTAKRLARCVSLRFHGAPSCADVTDLAGLPVYSFSVERQL